MYTYVVYSIYICIYTYMLSRMYIILYSGYINVCLCVCVSININYVGSIKPNKVHEARLESSTAASH